MASPSGGGQGRVALVTGGMGGLGETIATKMVDAGYRVVVTYSPGNTKHREWVQGMKDNGYDILAVQCDVADIDSCTRAVGDVQSKMGAIDILVNNAGITRDMTFKKMDKVNWDAVMRTNLDSLFNMSKQVVDGMVERNWGRIVFISSESGINIPVEMVHYGMTKTAQLAVARGLAETVAGSGVTVNAVLPGPTLSEGVATFMRQMAPEGGEADLDAMGRAFIRENRSTSLLGRLIAPEEIAGMVAYLCSPAASATTGAALRVDGGVIRAIA